MTPIEGRSRAEGRAAAPPPAERGRLAPLVRRVTLAIVFLLLAFLALGHWRGNVEWRRFQAAVAVVQAELDAEPGARPVLWGDAGDSSAWPHYERAIAWTAGRVDTAELARLCHIEGARLTGSPSTEKAKNGLAAADVVAASATALAELRAGAHSSDGRRPMDWQAGFNHPVQSLLGARDLASVAVLAAYLAAQAGDGDVAVQRLLDALQLGRDFAQSPQLIEQMIGCAVLQIAGKEAVTKANVLRRLDAAALRTFAVGLARLDASLSLVTRWIESDAVLFAHYDFDARPVVRGDPFGGLAWRSWRYGFSARLALANHGLSQLAMAQRVRALHARTDSIDVPAHDRLCADMAASPNPVTRLMHPNLSSAVKNRLQTIAALRVLRMAVAQVLGEPMEVLPDPMGGLLQSGVDAHGEAMFWSDASRKTTLLVVPK